MNKRIFIVFLLLVLIPFKVDAECSEDEKIRLSKLANNITTSVEYYEENNTFALTFLNLTGEFFIVDDNTDLNYQSDFELIIDNLQSGNYKYKIYDTNGCFENEVLTKTIKIPYYNKYYNYKECNDFHEYSYCSKWLQSNISYDAWKSKVDTYKKEEIIEEPDEESDKTPIDNIVEILVSLYVDYYYIFLPIIIISFVAIIYLKDRSDSIIYRKNKGEDITL